MRDVAKCWQRGLSGSLARRTKAVISGIEVCHGHREGLTPGVPGVTVAFHDWLGLRLVWWPQGIPRRRLVAIVSSRLGRGLERQGEWFSALRAVCEGMDGQREMLLMVPGTTAARYVARCATLFSLPLLRIEVPRSDSRPIGHWLRDVQRVGDPSCHVLNGVARLSPPLHAIHEHHDAASSLHKAPLRDRMLVALATRLEVLHVRRGGHLERLIEARLTDARWPPSSVRVAMSPMLTPGTLAGRLLRQGAVGWKSPEHHHDSSVTRALALPRESGPALHHRIVPMPVQDGWAYLTHCTRQQPGPWPGQSDDEYLDELILGRARSDRSAFGALERIVRQRRLVANRLAIRGGTRVVSFTEVPLAELPQLRAFRPHRGRWDFEPYGICIRRSWLENSGARAVRYGEEPLWEQLPEQERPFFQLARTRHARHAMDWTVEREWRHIGDVALGDVPSEAGLLFVPSEAEAQSLARISPWPVTVVRRGKETSLHEVTS
jgi:hypothetical protein